MEIFKAIENINKCNSDLFMLDSFLKQIDINNSISFYLNYVCEMNKEIKTDNMGTVEKTFYYLLNERRNNFLNKLLFMYLMKKNIGDNGYIYISNISQEGIEGDMLSYLEFDEVFDKFKDVLGDKFIFEEISKEIEEARHSIEKALIGEEEEMTEDYISQFKHEIEEEHQKELMESFLNNVIETIKKDSERLLSDEVEEIKNELYL